jgi:thermitase
VLLGAFFLQPAAVRAAPSLGAVQEDLYPREAAVQVQRGQQTLSVRPLKTVRTARGREAVADRLLVRFKSAVDTADLERARQRAAGLGAGVARLLKRIGPASYLVDVSGAGSLEAAAKAFATDSRVEFAGPDLIMRATETPNDTEFGQQWGMDRIQAPAAWNRTHGSTARRIAILDTGINELGADAHPDLAGKVVARSDFTNSPVGADDVFGHGTHVAGIAAAVTNNSRGVAGVGYSTRLLNAKVLDDTGTGSTSMLADGIYWATDNGAHVINMSLGGSEDCDPSWYEDVFDTGVNEVQDAINHAWSRNVVLVASAGNSGGTGELWPAACTHVLSVANTNRNDVRSNSSTYGTWVDVAAPGTAIWSTAVAGGSACQGNFSGGYANCSGTSMAAPHVSGLAALVQHSCALTSPQAVVDRITSTADAIAGTSTNWQYGRVNAVRAVCFPKPSNLRVGTVSSTSIQFLWDDNTPFESYFQIAHRVTGSSSWSYTTLPANTETWLRSGLTAGRSYDHQVRACDGNGCSGWSNMVTVTAGYTKLTASVSGSGKLTSTPVGINCGLGGSDCAEFYAPGTVVQVRATPLINPTKGIEWELDHWEGSCSGTATYTCTLTMSGARTARAVFRQAPSSPPIEP